METGIKGSDGELGVKGVGCRNHDGVEIASQQSLEVREEVRDPVACADGPAYGRRGIGQAYEVKALAVLPYIKCMLGLGDEAGSDQPDPQFLHERTPIGTIQSRK